MVDGWSIDGGWFMFDKVLAAAILSEGVSGRLVLLSAAFLESPQVQRNASISLDE